MIKSSLSFLFVTFLISIGSDGCYTQFATVSDEQTSVGDSTPINDQPVPVDPYPLPYYPHEHQPEYPHPSQLPTAGRFISSGTETDSPSSSPHRESGVQRGPASDQGTSHQSESTPSRTSWSPAPAAPSTAPATNSNAPVRTSGSTRGGR